MNILNEVRIGGYIVEVVGRDNIMLERGHQGEYHPMTQRIVLDTAMTLQQRREIFLHEIIEAIVSIYDINIEHRDLNLLGVVLHQIITDNPGIFKNKEVE